MTPNRPLFIAMLAVSMLASCTSRPMDGARPATVPTSPPTTRSSLVEFPGIVVDRASRQVRVDCEALSVEAPLEFFCVSADGPEHESVLRTRAKPSHIHAGLLLLGLEPGSPVQYDEKTNSWRPPSGPRVRVSVEWTDESGKRIHRPAEQLLRPTGKGSERATPRQWIFAGSHQRDDGTYLGDLTGYVVTLVNFDHALIDVSELVGSSDATLEWQTAVDAPKRGTAVMMILEPITP